MPCDHSFKTICDCHTTVHQRGQACRRRPCTQGEDSLTQSLRRPALELEKQWGIDSCDVYLCVLSVTLLAIGMADASPQNSEKLRYLHSKMGHHCLSSILAKKVKNLGHFCNFSHLTHIIHIVAAFCSDRVLVSSWTLESTQIRCQTALSAQHPAFMLQLVSPGGDMIILVVHRL